MTSTPTPEPVSGTTGAYSTYDQEVSAILDQHLLTIGGLGVAIGCSIYAVRQGWLFLKSVAR